MTGSRFHHVGLVVADLDRALAFYRDRLGLVLLATGVEADPRYAEMLGVARVRFAWAELDLGDGHVLELLRFDEPAAPAGAGREADPARAVGTGASAPPSPTEPGGAHLGIVVDDVDAVHEALVQNGVDVVRAPIELVEDNQWRGVRVFYARDPDGHLVELVQEAPGEPPAGLGDGPRVP